MIARVGVSWRYDGSLRVGAVLRRGGLAGTLLVLAACGGSTPAPSDGRLASAPMSGEQQVLRGRQLVLEGACGDCHGGFANPAAEGWLDGVRGPAQVFQIGAFKTYPRNLTPDNATGLGRFSERQIFNALRYGLRPGETPDVEITSSVPGQGNFPASPKYLGPPMPWPEYRHMPDRDLWAIAAYLKRGLRPVANQVPDSEGPPDFWAGTFTVENFGTYPAPAFPTAVEREPEAGSREQVLRGRKLAIVCSGCHGGIANPASEEWLSGVRRPEQSFQIGPFRTSPRNLTPDNATGLGRFSERQIFNALRYGLRPGETPDVEITSAVPGQGNFPLYPKYLAPPMPWPTFRHMPDEDLRAIAAYLKRGVRPVANKVPDSEGPPDFWASEYTPEKYGTYPAPAFPTARERRPE